MGGVCAAADRVVDTTVVAAVSVASNGFYKKNASCTADIRILHRHAWMHTLSHKSYTAVASLLDCTVERQIGCNDIQTVNTLQMLNQHDSLGRNS